MPTATLSRALISTSRLRSPSINPFKRRLSSLPSSRLRSPNRKWLPHRPAAPVPAVEPAPPVAPPISAAVTALYAQEEEESDAERQERELAALLERAAEQRAAAAQQNFGSPAPVTPTAAANTNPLSNLPVPPRPVPTVQDNPVQPAGLAQGQMVRRTEIPPVRQEFAEDILEAARNRVLAAARAPLTGTSEQRPATRIEPAFATDPALRPPSQPVQQPAFAQQPVQPAVQPPREKTKEELAAEFEAILEAEMAANGLEFDEPVVAQPAPPVLPVQPVLAQRPANLPQVTGATPDNALEREMQRLLAQHDLDQQGRKA